MNQQTIQMIRAEENIDFFQKKQAFSHKPQQILKVKLLQQMETYIISENLKPGDQLPGELELAKRFGVSRGTIREVISYLVLKGILERRTSRGTTLRSPKIGDIASELGFQLKLLNCGLQELKEAREILELSIVPSLITYATPTHIDRLVEINENMLQLQHNLPKADKLDLCFHTTLFNITGNRLLRLFAQILTVQFEGKSRPPFPDAADVRRSSKEHSKMIEAINERDSNKLNQAITDHIGGLPSY